MSSYIHLLSHTFEPITLPEMANVSLLNRTDTKFVLTNQQLIRALKSVRDRYRVLTIKDVRIQHYKTLYFDTPKFALYMRHHNGGDNRYKVRCRKYVESDLCFLEVKFKNNKSRTIKSRLKIPYLTGDLLGEAYPFLSEQLPFDPQWLEPKIWTNFQRLTMVNKYRPERLTLDINLEFMRYNTKKRLPKIVIAEVKQEGFSLQSDFIKQMRRLNLQPAKFSKYCMGISSIYPQMKRNNLKKTQNFIKKLFEQGVYA